MKKILILGKGAFGSAIGHCLNNDNELYFFTRKDIGLKINHKIKKVFYDINECFYNAKYDFIFIALPSKEIIDIFKIISKYIREEVIVVNCSKGLAPEFNWEKIIKSLNNNFIYTALNGPSFASEMFKNEMTVVNIFAPSINIFDQIISLFDNSIIKFFYVENNFDVSELVSSLKNAVAIGMGLVCKFSNSPNTINAIYTLALKEVKRITTFLLDKEVELIDFFGIGDYTMCCFNKESRNFLFGFNFLKKEDELSTIEGERTIEVINKRCQNLNLVFFSQLYNILKKKKKPQEFLKSIFGKI